MGTHPYGHVEVLVLDILNIEAHGRDGRDDFVELHLVQHAGLARRIEAEHEHSRGRAEGEELGEVFESLGDGEPHGGGCWCFSLPVLLGACAPRGRWAACEC